MYMRMYIVHRGVCMCTMKSHLQFIDSTSTMICKKTLIFTDTCQDVFLCLNCEKNLQIVAESAIVRFGSWGTGAPLIFLDS